MWCSVNHTTHRQTASKKCSIFPQKTHFFFPKKEHLLSTYRADSVRTSCILCDITLLLYACCRHKNGHFYPIPAKISFKKCSIFPYRHATQCKAHNSVINHYTLNTKKGCSNQSNLFCFPSPKRETVREVIISPLHQVH